MSAVPAILAATTTADFGWLEVSGRLAAASALGGALGFEREAHGRDAGLRTHMLLSLGSALFAVASVGAFDAFVAPRNDTNVVVDVTRIAAYVPPGVGFIGAGVIVKRTKQGGRSTVHGLTTAASLWAAAAVGVAAGLGFWSGAVMTAVIALVALAVLRPVSEFIDGRRGPRHRRAGLHVTLERDAVGRVVDALGDRLVGDVRVGAGPPGSAPGSAQLDGSITLAPSDDRGHALVVALTEVRGVLEVELTHDEPVRDAD